MTLTSSELTKQLTPFEFTPGRKASWVVLARLLPDVDTAMFFAKAYNMDYTRLSALITGLFDTPFVQALSEGTHSESLQDYIVSTVPTDVIEMAGGAGNFTAPHVDILSSMWDSIDLTVADSLQKVAAQLAGVLDSLPTKQGQMTFTHMAKLNKQRPTLGVYGASIVHHRIPDALVIFDVSGSMTEQTVRSIAPEVIAMAYKANAHFAIVSYNTYYWEPGKYSLEDVLDSAEYYGTCYETLAPLFKRDWGTVITIADFDSSPSAKDYLASQGGGRIGRVLDLSLVNRPTYLAECVGQFADEVQPLLIGNGRNVISY